MLPVVPVVLSVKKEILPARAVSLVNLLFFIIFLQFSCISYYNKL